MIRDVGSADYGRITAIYNHYVEHTTVSMELEPVSEQEMRERAEQVLDGHFPYVVAEHDGLVAGFAYAHHWKSRLAYRFTCESAIYVDRSLLRHGIGSELMADLIRRCKEAGIRNLIACITADNVRSIKFHEQFGFKQASHFVNAGYKFSTYLDVIDLQLQL